jgi:hypothetical protein
MPTPIKPIRRAEHQSTRGKDWKDHPLVVAVIAAVSTAVFFMTVVLPLRVDLLTSKVERLSTTASEAMTTAEKLERVEKDLTESSAALRLATMKSPFAERSVYPLGLDKAVPGTPVLSLVQRYPNGKWGEENSYYTVAGLENGVVHAATYYFDGIGDKRTVVFVMFHIGLSNSSAGEIVSKHFLETFGEPITGRRGARLWKATPHEWVVVDAGARTYHVYQAGYGMALLDFDGVNKK